MDGNYLWGIAAKKVAYALAKVLVAFIGSVAIKTLLAKYGVTVDPTVLMGSATTAIYAVLEWAHDYAKVKLGVSWL